MVRGTFTFRGVYTAGHHLVQNNVCQSWQKKFEKGEKFWQKLYR